MIMWVDDIWGDDEDDDDDDDVGDKGEPEWIRSEREQFANFRDKNRDGKLDREEIEEWIIPEDYDHSAAEAAHLMQSSDENRVGAWSFKNVSHSCASERTKYNLCLMLWKLLFSCQRADIIPNVKRIISFI